MLGRVDEGVPAVVGVQGHDVVQVLKAGGLRGGQQDPFVVAVARVVGPFSEPP